MAVTVLRAAMLDQSATPAARVAAARAVLEFGFRGAEIADLEERLAVVEAELDRPTPTAGDPDRDPRESPGQSRTNALRPRAEDGRSAGTRGRRRRRRPWPLFGEGASYEVEPWPSWTPALRHTVGSPSV